jgi:CheY-like chemotaxis protein
VGEVIDIARETFPKDIVFERAVPPHLWPIIADATQIHQLLLNLCLNARDAMPSGGKIRITAANLELDENYASMVPDAKPGSYVVLQVVDNGSGMPPEVVDRIFDPFFTTKDIGKGTGLGLSTVHGIVKGHRGFIQVTSALGKGTAFEVYLAAAPDSKGEVRADDPERPPKDGGGKLVLVVDDEPAVRIAACRVLESGGYEAMAAADGTEALAMFVKNATRISLVLTDLTMPHLDGMALIRALRRAAPELPIIASTGLDDKSKLFELKNLRVGSVLYKPYSGNALLKTVGRCFEDA